MFTTFDKILEAIRVYCRKPEGFISLHEPVFAGNEKKYVLDAIDSTYVSSVGKYVNQFESMVSAYTGSHYAVATVNGTAALHMSLLLAGVKRNDLVITQPLSFVATCNAISYSGANPLFIDIDLDTLGLSPTKLNLFLEQNCRIENDKCIHISSGRKIAACVPMHTFGHPVHMDELVNTCNKFGIPIIEDAAESIGTLYKGKHTGTIGLIGAFSFNGNKTITCGGGGMIVTNDKNIAERAKHLTTQAKIAHVWEFSHDEIGYNYRLPNLNAAMACAQMEMLDKFIEVKREFAQMYNDLFRELDLNFVHEPKDARSNYWLNGVLFDDKSQRDEFLKYSNDNKVMTRPAWSLMTDLTMFQGSYCDDISNSRKIANCLVNLPSSPILK